ncbi:MAG: molybdopterin synthase sulfur carrier subunit [Candidatus Parabeggiatoa sp. nov. 1]|nr:MAG: molybdopterin synthase sulfur carrier subunit [Gammaproteobacteria bacterium]
MTIAVKFFASLREEIGKSEINIETHKPMEIVTVWAQASNNALLPDYMLIAVNRKYVDKNTLVQDGDEVAFFPPVTGG